MGQFSDSLENAATFAANPVAGAKQLYDNAKSEAADFAQNGVNEAKEKFVSFMTDNGGDNAMTRAANRGVAYAADKVNDRIDQIENGEFTSETPEVQNADAPDAEKLMNATKAPDAQQLLNILMQKAGGR